MKISAEKFKAKRESPNRQKPQMTLKCSFFWCFSRSKVTSSIVVTMNLRFNSYVPKEEPEKLLIFSKPKINSQLASSSKIDNTVLERPAKYHTILPDLNLQAPTHAARSSFSALSTHHSDKKAHLGPTQAIKREMQVVRPLAELSPSHHDFLVGTCQPVPRPTLQPSMLGSPAPCSDNPVLESETSPHEQAHSNQTPTDLSCLFFVFLVLRDSGVVATLH